MIAPTLLLECARCDPGQYRPPGTAGLDVLLLHTQVEHDTDEIELILAAVCTCGATMTHRDTRPTGGGEVDYFDCPACGETGRIRRHSERRR